ncbi:MAG: serine hydrolase [Oscillospiraceae bacterium]|jgi:D-alanyl-D-alanine carboxypeptidase|nr:serine hydrolase [Oscillospiraceae bacterium]
MIRNSVHPFTTDRVYSSGTRRKQIAPGHAIYISAGARPEKYMRRNHAFSFSLLAFSLALLVASLFYISDQKSLASDIDDMLPIAAEGPRADEQIFETELPESSEEETPFVVPDLSREKKLPFEVLSESVFLYDLNKDEIVYSKNPEKLLTPASLAKVMTAALTLENVGNLDEKMTYQQHMTDELTAYGFDMGDLSNYGFMTGETVSVRDALYILMLRSGNDAANLLADYVGGGDLGKFIDMMNAKALELGARNTRFTNAHGLDDSGLFTTAYDLFLITKYAMSLPHFMEIAESSFYKVPANNLRQSVTISTVLEMQNQEYAAPDFYYPYLRGIKTGYTEKAGRCLISSAENGGKHFLMIIMGTPLKDADGGRISGNTVYFETRRLYDWAFENG